MDPGTRTAILIAGITFCGLFGALTVAVALNDGVTIFVVFSLVIVGMIASGLIGAIRNPPPDD